MKHQTLYQRLEDAEDAAKDCLQYEQGLLMSIFRSLESPGFYVLEGRQTDWVHKHWVKSVILTMEHGQKVHREFKFEDQPCESSATTLASA